MLCDPGLEEGGDQFVVRLDSRSRATRVSLTNAPASMWT